MADYVIDFQIGGEIIVRGQDMTEEEALTTAMNELQSIADDIGDDLEDEFDPGLEVDATAEASIRRIN